MSEIKIRALIVDDEPPARAVIRKMLAEDADIEIIGECSNGIGSGKIYLQTRARSAFSRY